MGSKRIHKKEDKKFRDFLYLDNKPDSPAKFYYIAIRWARKNSTLKPRQIEALFFMHDLEFFTCQWLGKQLKVSYFQTKDKLIGPLVRDGYLFKYFDRRAVSYEDDSMWFRDENRFNYRVRYSLTQKSKLFIAKMYRIMAGDAKVETEYDESAIAKDRPDKSKGGPRIVRKKRLKGFEDSPLGKKIISNQNAYLQHETASQEQHPREE